jgi:hypothetical protein
MQEMEIICLEVKLGRQGLAWGSPFAQNVHDSLNFLGHTILSADHSKELVTQ